MSDRHAADLRARLEAEAAIGIAFAPLRGRRTDLSPKRVRAAVRWGRGAPPSAMRWSGPIARLSELSLAVGMSVVIFAAAFGPVDTLRPPDATETAAAVDATDAPATDRTTAAEDVQIVRSLRFDRPAPAPVPLVGLVSLQDRLDPTVLRAQVPRRLEPPAPRGGSSLSPRHPY